MQVKELVLLVGPTRFATAAKLARRTAEDTGVSMPPNDPLLWTLPQEIGDHLLAHPAPWSTRIATLFKVYRELPCYGVLEVLSANYPQFEEEERDLHFRECLDLLDTGEHQFQRPVEYYLWCDFFETGDRCEDAWEAMVSADTPKNALRSLLLISGPVPFDLKLPLYRCLLPEPAWHHFIFLSLLHSHFEEYGQLDPEPAIEIVKQLQIPASTPDWSRLQRALGVRPGLKIL